MNNITRMKTLFYSSLYYNVQNSNQLISDVHFLFAYYLITEDQIFL
jgi:hypothetical protein